jgi:hypothetical protein
MLVAPTAHVNVLFEVVRTGIGLAAGGYKHNIALHLILGAVLGAFVRQLHALACCLCAEHLQQNT